MKYLNEKEMVEELNEYINNTNIKYSILINGPWGSGKTYFIKNYVEKINKKFAENNKDNPKAIYISLYGINDVKEINKKMFFSLINNKKAQKFLNFLDNGTNYLLNMVASNLPIKCPDVPEGTTSDIVSEYKKIENAVIILDDLERCSMDINVLFGYINELVEHKNLKVIIVADEKKIDMLNYNKNIELKYLVALSEKLEIEKSDENDRYRKAIGLGKENDSDTLTKQQLKKETQKIFNQNEIYNEIKEKLIGKTLYYKADISKVYDSLLKTITNDAAKQAAKRNKDDFLYYLEKQDYNNIRTIKFIFDTYNNIIEKTINLIDFSDVKGRYLSDMLKYCEAKCIELKSGNVSDNWDKSEEIGDVIIGNIENKNIYFDIFNTIYGFKFFDRYILYSSFDKNEVREILLTYVEEKEYENNNQDDPLFKLEYWQYKTEKEVKEILDELMNKVKNNEYILQLYPKIIATLSWIESYKLFAKKIKKIIKAMENNLSTKKVKGRYNENEDDLYLGNYKKIYEENIQKIRELAHIKQNKKKTEEIEKIYSSDKWGENLYNYFQKDYIHFSEKNKPTDYFLTEKIIYNIDNKAIKEIYEFKFAIEKLFKNSNIVEYLKSDTSNFKVIIEEIDKINTDDKVREIAINLLKISIEDKINKYGN